MVAIFTGAGTGFERGSGSMLGALGLLGGASLGRGSEQLFFNAANGNLLISHRDEYLVGRGPDVGITRTYNSLGNFTDENGDNWRQSTDRRVFGLSGSVNSAGSSVKRRSADGSEISYGWNGSAYVATDGAGAYDTLVYSGGNWTWTDGDSRVSETYTAYGADWRIVSQTDTSGNSVTYSYSGDKLWRTTTADGGYVEYAWAGNNITTLTTGYLDNGTNTNRVLTRTRYGYDGYNRLSSVTVDLSPEDNSIADGRVYTTSYSYYGTSKLIQTISQTDGSSVTIGYDGAGRVTNWTQAVADGVSRTTSIGYGAGYTVITDAAGQATTLSYDGNGQLTQITAPPAYAGAAQQVVRFGYTGNGDLASVTDASGKTTSYTYDGNGNVLTTTDRTGQQVVRTYNAANQVLTESRVGSDKDSGGAWHTTRYVYDAANRLRFTISPEGRVTEYRYDGVGQLVWQMEYTSQFYNLNGLASSVSPAESQLIDWSNSLADPTQVDHIQFVYDARGGLIQRISYGDAFAPGSPHGWNGYTHEFFTYDQAGQLLASVVAGQNWKTYAYDGLGRVVSSTDLNGMVTSFAFSDASLQTIVTLANGFVQTSTYNRAGDLVSFTESGSDTAGGTSSYKYDQLGRLRQKTNANGYIHYYLYDKVGRKIVDANQWGYISEYRYDQNGRLAATINYTNILSAEQLSWLSDPNSSVEMASLRPAAHPYDIWTWKIYDAEGRVIEAIAGDGSVTRYDYDGSGRLVATTGYTNRLSAEQVNGFKSTSPLNMVLPAGSGRDPVSQVFYDKDGNVLGTLNGEGYLSRTVYDAGGRKVQEIAYANATNPALRASGTLQDLINSVGSSGGDRSTRYVYDQQDHLRFVIDALGQVTEYNYQYDDWKWSAFGPVRSTTQYAGTIGALSSYTFASVKNAVVGMATNPANRVSYAVYDNASRLKYSIDAGGAVTGYSYDAMGHVTRTVRYAAAYSPGALPSQETMDNWAAANAGNGANRITRNYYAARGELRFTIDPEGYVTRIDYDGEGREVFRARWNAPVAANDGWTLATVNGAVTGDWAGNWSYYDVDGRLIVRSDSEGRTRSYSYLANGDLYWEISQHLTGEEVRTVYIHDGAGRVIEQYDAWGTPEQRVTRYTYDGLGNQTSVTDGRGITSYRSYDKLGRVVSETNGIGGVKSYQYDALGNLVRTTDERGVSTYSYYDTLGRVVAMRDGEDYVTETSYTLFGEVRAVTRRYNRSYAQAGVGIWPAVNGDGRDATTTFSYDKLGRTTVTTDAEGYSEVRWYDAFGNVTQVQNKLGGITRYTYDRRGSLRTEWVEAPVFNNGGAMTASGYFRNVYEYDARGNVVHQIEASGLAEQRDTYFTYDKADRLIQKRVGEVQVVSQDNHISLWNTTPTTTYRYDKRDNLIETVDPNGARTLFYYDRQNRKIAELSAVGTLTSYTYDAVGNLIAQRSWATPVAQPGTAGGSPPAAPGGEYRETTYGYDNLNRLTSTSVANIRYGWWDGQRYQMGFGTLTSWYEYDAVGNLVRSQDQNGVSAFTYYDRAGRKIAQVDREGYVTRWTLDAEGNAVQERRYANQTGGASVQSQPGVGESGADRITNFTYDRNGRRLTEQRLNVVAYTVPNGTLQSVPTTSLVSYTYNGLGQVTSKTEATGDRTTYEYDASGRLAKEFRPVYLNGSTPVQSVLAYQYDGLGDLSRTEQSSSLDGARRVTRYVYDRGGRMVGMINTNEQGTEYYAHEYYYDAAGNLLRQAYRRARSDDSVAYDSILYTRDAAGRVTSQTTATLDGSAWLKGDIQNIAYNAFGEISQRGINGGWQEQFAYDGRGKLYRSNAGDGVWRYYLYDGAGNQTAAIESEGSAIGGLSLDGILGIVTAGWVWNPGSLYIDGINVTVTSYDRRGQGVRTIQKNRQLADDTLTDIVTTRGYNAFGEVTSDTDARGGTTYYAYNTMGRLTWVQRPAVQITNSDGNSYIGTPADTYYYDLSGRMVGHIDANGNRTTRALLAGTGYGGSEALVTIEWHADGGAIQNFYDGFGDLRRQINEVGRETRMDYDAMGRLLQVTRPSGNADYYVYDILGQRIKHWTSLYGIAAMERTDYDSQGRVVSQVSYTGDVTATSYSWSGGLTTTGMGTFGGWVKT
ncbi:RHS repeat protein, partial [Sphingomonas elodea]|uniref:RHS repeat protein n=2 Tax=Pseudomonadota TaxID=1224 RepID=UPI000263138B